MHPQGSGHRAQARGGLSRQLPSRRQLPAKHLALSPFRRYQPTSATPATPATFCLCRWQWRASRSWQTRRLRAQLLLFQRPQRISHPLHSAQEGPRFRKQSRWLRPRGHRRNSPLMTREGCHQPRHLCLQPGLAGHGQCHRRRLDSRGCSPFHSSQLGSSLPPRPKCRLRRRRSAPAPCPRGASHPRAEPPGPPQSCQLASSRSPSPSPLPTCQHRRPNPRTAR